MATMTMPGPAAAADPRPAGDVRLVRIRANLMPDEVVIARRTEALRRQILFALLIVLALLIAWFGVTWWQTHSSNNDLSDANHRQTALQQQTLQYGSLVQAQNDVTSIDGQLNKLMVGDLPWRTMLATLRSKAPSGVELTNVVGAITSGAAATSVPGQTASSNQGYGVFNLSGQQAVGTLTITGTAHDKKSIAQYLDTLAGVKGLAAPTPTNITTTANNQINFTVSVIITSDALGGRYAQTAQTPSATPSTSKQGGN